MAASMRFKPGGFSLPRSPPRWPCRVPACGFPFGDAVATGVLRLDVRRERQEHRAGRAPLPYPIPDPGPTHRQAGRYRLWASTTGAPVLSRRARQTAKAAAPRSAAVRAHWSLWRRCGGCVSDGRGCFARAASGPRGTRESNSRAGNASARAARREAPADFPGGGGIRSPRAGRPSAGNMGRPDEAVAALPVYVAAVRGVHPHRPARAAAE